jgi:hypothetical protein
VLCDAAGRSWYGKTLIDVGKLVFEKSDFQLAAVAGDRVRRFTVREPCDAASAFLVTLLIEKRM